MKKTTLSLAVGLCLSIAGLAQTQRTILYEEFTGENCGPCAATNPGLTSFIHQTPGYFPTKVLMIRYQCNIPSAPGAGSLYVDNSSEEGVRQTYYTVPFAPYARFDGIVLPEPASQGTGSDGHAYWIEDATDYPNIVPDSAIVNSPFALTVNHVFSPAYDSVTITAVVTAAQNYTASTTGALVLQVAMEEAAIHFANPTGSNGEKDFYDVMRKMVPNASGTALNNTWATAATQTITLKAKIPTYIHDKNQLAFVAFVQDNGPKRVHQAAYSQPKSVNLDASTTAIASSPILCSATIPVSATIANPGMTTLTSCLVNYKLDAGTVNTYTWSGSLAQGTSTVIALPSLTGTAGTHTLTVYTSMPNNGTDQNAANDKQTSSVILEITPSTTSIVEGFTLTAFPPANWAKHNTDGSSSQWVRGTAGNAPTTGNSAKYPFYTNGSIGDIDELYMPYVDLTNSTNAQLKFDYAYNYYFDHTSGEIDDSLAVMLSTDCGSTWNQLFYDGGATLVTALTPGDSNEYVPASTEWKSKTISLTSYATGPVLMKFVAINNYGNDIYLDNVNITFSVAGIAKNNGNISNVKVYPNPANSQFNINVNLTASEKTSVSLYNVMGQVVFTKNFDFNAGENLVNIPVDQLSNGMYTVLVSSTSGSYQTKLSVIK